MLCLWELAEREQMQSEGDKNGNDLPAVQTLTKSPAEPHIFLDSPSNNWCILCCYVVVLIKLMKLNLAKKEYIWHLVSVGDNEVINGILEPQSSCKTPGL